MSRLFARVKRLRGPVVAIAAVGAVLSGLVGYWNTYRTVRDGVAPATVTSNLPADAGPLSIVVLPFTNQTGDPQKAYIADGLTSSITADLSRIRDAFIVPVSSAVAYRDKAAPVKQIGQDLGVRFVLQGSVLANGNKLRINAQLADAQSGAQKWTETFEGDLADLFALQDQVTARIGNSIGNQMVILAARESQTRKSGAKVADLILRADALGLNPQSLQNWKDVEALLRQALVADPGNATATVGWLKRCCFRHSTLVVSSKTTCVRNSLRKAARWQSKPKRWIQTTRTFMVSWSCMRGSKATPQARCATKRGASSWIPAIRAPTTTSPSSTTILPNPPRRSSC